MTSERPPPDPDADEDEDEVVTIRGQTVLRRRAGLTLAGDLDRYRDQPQPQETTDDRPTRPPDPSRAAPRRA